jgi:hypothetical protein
MQQGLSLGAFFFCLSLVHALSVNFCAKELDKINFIQLNYELNRKIINF